MNCRPQIWLCALCLLQPGLSAAQSNSANGTPSETGALANEGFLILQASPVLRGASIAIRSSAAESRTKCDAIASLITKQVFAGTTFEPGANVRGSSLDCRAARAVPSQAQLELSRAFYDRQLQGWEFFMRCGRSSDCVPFLVRMPDGPENRALGQILAQRASKRGLTPAADQSAYRSASSGVRPGQTVQLLWESSGLRIALPVVSLGAGHPGDSVRVRVRQGGGAVLRARVVASGMLRVSEDFGERGSKL